MKLISMVDYVLEKNKLGLLYLTAMDSVVNYAKLLSMPLTLGMFVPTNEEGNVLEEPKSIESRLGIHLFNHAFDFNSKQINLGVYKEQYQKALSNVIFEGFEYQESRQENCYNFIRYPDRSFPPLYPKLWNGTAVENLISRNLTLTKSAITKYQI